VLGRATIEPCKSTWAAVCVAVQHIQAAIAAHCQLGDIAEACLHCRAIAIQRSRVLQGERLRLAAGIPAHCCLAFGQQQVQAALPVARDAGQFARHVTRAQQGHDDAVMLNAVDGARGRHCRQQPALGIGGHLPGRRGARVRYRRHAWRKVAA
jgi:hypothetical protein